MKTTHHLERRDFLRRASGALGLLALTQILDLPQGAQAATETAQGQAELDRLMGRMETSGREMLSVPRKDGQFLNMMTKATRTRNVLEVGTSQGYSAIWISLGLNETDGQMITIDIDPDKVRLAKDNVAKAGLTHRVTFKEGDAHKIVPTLEGPFDFVFLDADKEGQMDYFNSLYPNKLSPGGIIAVHNAIRLGRSMKDYLDMIQKHPDFDSVILTLTMDDGFSVSYRKRR